MTQTCFSSSFILDMENTHQQQKSYGQVVVPPFFFVPVFGKRGLVRMKLYLTMNLILSTWCFFFLTSYVYKNAATQNDGGIDMSVRNGSLVSRLRIDPKKEADFAPLPGLLLRKYIAYARTYVFPR